MSQIAPNQDATQELLAAALVIARSPTIRAWLRANDPMALQQLDTAVAAHQNTDPTAEPVYLVINCRGVAAWLAGGVVANLRY